MKCEASTGCVFIDFEHSNLHLFYNNPHVFKFANQNSIARYIISLSSSHFLLFDVLCLLFPFPISLGRLSFEAPGSNRSGWN